LIEASSREVSAAVGILQGDALREEVKKGKEDEQDLSTKISNDDVRVEVVAE
jgi:hypothetical protein